MVNDGRKLKVLVIADEVWNDSINGNNVLTNWFQDFPAEFAEIYASPGVPYNKVCKKYFQITDREMINSIFLGKKAGKSFEGDYSISTDACSAYNGTDVGHLDFMRKHTGNILRMLKTIVWNIGKIDEEDLSLFIKGFKPDIIFSARFAHSKILRIEKLALKYANCPIIAFTGDNEYSLRRFSLSPIFWMNLLYQRRKLKEMMPKYSLYYTLSERQIQEYRRYFKIPMKVLRKCSMAPLGEFHLRPVESPIQIVYGGKIYVGREKTLLALVRAINKINIDHVEVQLHIYTSSKVDKKIERVLNDERNSFLHNAVSSEKLDEIYHKSDIALTVESFELSNRLATRVSFSTKIIDCLCSSCAVMMIGWRENSGFEYLKKNHAAICIGNETEIYPRLKKVIADKELLQKYRRSAFRCIKKNHDRIIVQESIMNDFLHVKG